MIIHIVGKPRSGKGVLATFLALSEADRGRVIDSNYHMDSPNCNYISFFDLLAFLKKPRVEPTHLLVIDELPGWCDSYTSSTKSSRFASHFLNQSQKLGYDLIFTSQRSMRADINFRELSDVRFKAEKDVEKKCFTYKVLDAEFTDEDIETGKSFAIPFDMAKDFWCRFDTYEAVPPVGLDEVLADIQASDSKLLNKEINRQIQLIEQNYVGFRPYNKVQTDDLLIELGESTKFSAVVCARMQRRQHSKPQLQQTVSSPTIQNAVPQENYRQKWLIARNKN